MKGRIGLFLVGLASAVVGFIAIDAGTSSLGQMSSTQYGLTVAGVTFLGGFLVVVGGVVAFVALASRGE